MVEKKVKAQGKEIKKEKENAKMAENQEMELELSGDELEQEMEPIVKDQIKKEEKANQTNKSKPGPKAGSTKKKNEGKEAAPKKEKELNLNDFSVVLKEIKKGRISSPQGRIEKTEDGNYKLLLKDGVIFPTDGKFEVFDTIDKMIVGKDVVTLEAAKRFATNGKFKAKHENGEELEHNYVRIELHKPGRKKDVVEIFTIKEAQNKLKQRQELEMKREAEKKKKEEKEKAEKEEEKAI